MTIDALVCSEPGKLELLARPTPLATAGRVLVRPRRVGICGTDYHIFEGKHPYLAYPRVMGHELAVEIVDAPADSGLKAGEICTVNPYLSCGHCRACLSGKPNCCVRISVLGIHEDGGMAGLLAVPPQNLIPAPGLSIDECATVEFLAIGAHAVRRGAVTRDDRVLVVGAGPIGLGVALFARLAGATVFALDRDPERAATAEILAGVRPIDASGIAAATNGDGFDVVFDATGNPDAMEQGFDHVGHGGRYVLVSVVKGAIGFKDPDFHRKEMTLLGSRNALRQDFEQVMSAIRAGNVPVQRLITHRTTLAGAVRELPKWATAKSGLVKAVIEIDR